MKWVFLGRLVFDISPVAMTIKKGGRYTQLEMTSPEPCGDLAA
jgi:hypothetical protein